MAVFADRGWGFKLGAGGGDQPLSAKPQRLLAGIRVGRGVQVKSRNVGSKAGAVAPEELVVPLHVAAGALEDAIALVFMHPARDEHRLLPHHTFPQDFMVLARSSPLPPGAAREPAGDADAAEAGVGGARVGGAPRDPEVVAPAILRLVPGDGFRVVEVAEVQHLEPAVGPPRGGILGASDPAR